MRREVTSHIRQAANALNADSGATTKEIIIGDIGCLATVLHESEGQASGAYRRNSSCMPDVEICTAYGPSYMMQKQHRHWYHVGQYHHQTAPLQHMQQQLLPKAQQGMLRPSQAEDEVLQSFDSNTSSSNTSRSSSPGGLPALPRLQPMNSSTSSSCEAAPLSCSGSSSSDEDRFQAQFDSESAACTPTYAGDNGRLGMLLAKTTAL
ncbi:hypothetical protein COO60DRAFT_1526282 [Scenedesmus sp. NREL 46B-D3]|nr:hypothetical protein COO60DRAFT_1526282 [Scenedesmus sp. NREL 46B-D3]